MISGLGSGSDLSCFRTGVEPAKRFLRRLPTLKSSILEHRFSTRKMHRLGNITVDGGVTQGPEGVVWDGSVG